MRRFSPFVAVILLCAGLFCAAQAQVPMTGAGLGVPTSSGPVAFLTPIYGPAYAQTVSTAGVNFFPLFSGTSGGGIAIGGTTRAWPVPISGTISNLQVRIGTANAVSGSQWDIGLWYNGSFTSLHCTIPNGQQTCASTATVSVAAGTGSTNAQTLLWVTCPGTITSSCTTGTAPTAASSLQISATITGTNANESIIGTTTNGQSIAAGTPAPSYMGMGATTATATQAANATVVAAPGVIDDMQVSIGAAPGTLESWAYTLWHNNAATSLTCTVGPSASALTCQDTTAGHAVTVAANDTLSIEACPIASVGGSGGGTATCTPGTGTNPVTTVVAVGFRWQPTVNGQSLLFMTASLFPSVSNQFANISGNGATTSTEANAYNVTPDTSVIKIKNLYVLGSTAPGGSATRTYTLRLSGVNQLLKCTIASASLGCNDPTDVYTASAGDLLDWAHSVSGSPATETNFTASAVVCTLSGC